MLDDGTRWLHERNLQCKFKNKNIKLFGENLQGHSVLLCRFLCPQAPPEKVIENIAIDDYAIEKAARFVSMIPYIEDLRLFKDLPDLYSTS